MIRKILLGTVFLIAGAIIVLWLGAFTSLDHDRAHSAATEALPKFDPQLAGSDTPALMQISARGMVFRARAAGFPGRAGNVLMLHGFPETSIMYEDAIAELARAGYAVVAFDQRGYSPGARPEALEEYAVSALIDDARAVADAVGFDRYHLVGHDWGAAVGWLLVMQDASRVDSWTALSIPHLIAYGEAMQLDPDQQSRSSYITFFRTPWVPEVLFSFNDFSMLRDNVYTDHPAEVTKEYLEVLSEPGALTAALNWYRAGDLRVEDSGELFQPEITIPTLFIWGDSDPVVGQAALDTQRGYFEGPFRELELDTGHWLMQSRPAATTSAILTHLKQVGEQP
jgi:pimeloyl-ACP methyl ester carboxylesterase